MLDACFIGDELTGAGFALAGVRSHPAPGSTEGLWRLVLAERERRQLVVLSAECGRPIREKLSQLLESHPLPPIVVLPGPAPADGPDGTIGEALDALGIEGISR